MEEIIKSPLKMKNGAEVRTLDELKENFDLESVLSYYLNGQLVTWLRNYYYDNIADKVEALDSASDDIPRQLCNIIGVEYVEVDITIDDIKEKLEHRKMLQELLPEEELQFVATNDTELRKLLENGAEKVYLAFGEFRITDDSADYIVIKSTNANISSFYSVNENNLEKAKKCADNGIAAAQYQVGLFCYNEAEKNQGFTSLIGNFIAKQYMKLAADQEYIDAITWISKNDYNTFENCYYEKIKAKAKKGNAAYQLILGNYFRRNRIISQAEYWLKLAAQSDSREGKQAKKMFEDYDYYFKGEGIDETPLLIFDGLFSAIGGLFKAFFGNLNTTGNNPDNDEDGGNEKGFLLGIRPRQ